MGSEGRGEQTVRTDQDNGLLLADPVPQDELQAFREAFSGALARFGFPPCPGHVMVDESAMVAAGRRLHPPDQGLGDDAG